VLRRYIKTITLSFKSNIFLIFEAKVVRAYKDSAILFSLSSYIEDKVLIKYLLLSTHLAIHEIIAGAIYFTL